MTVKTKYNEKRASQRVTKARAIAKTEYQR